MANLNAYKRISNLQPFIKMVYALAELQTKVLS